LKPLRRFASTCEQEAGWHSADKELAWMRSRHSGASVARKRLGVREAFADACGNNTCVRCESVARTRDEGRATPATKMFVRRSP
jgi:hypothetical protein